MLLTADAMPADDGETILLVHALADLGVSAAIVPWTSPDLSASSADLAVIRSTWDYTGRVAEFLGVLDHLPMPLVNNAGVVRWNAHKGYLTELAAAGVAVVPSTLFRAGASEVTLPAYGTPEIVVKPAVSAGAGGVGRFVNGSPDALSHLRAILTTADALVQPFQPDVVTGERSLMYFGGLFSHAVRKTPADGDFRVQAEFGGTNRPHVPSIAELVLADAAVAAVPAGPDTLVYARVDVVGPESAPLVMEVELIEPELFLSLCPGTAQRFAQALASLL